MDLDRFCEALSVILSDRTGANVTVKWEVLNETEGGTGKAEA